MPSALANSVSADDDVRSVAQTLAGAPLVALSHAASGGNSRIYRVETADGVFALKYYPPVAPGSRDRLGAEVAALRLMQEHGVQGTPRTLGSQGRFALYSWMDGVLPTQVTVRDVDAACDFLAQLPRLSRSPEAQQFPLAAEACLSLEELRQQVARRATRLQEVSREEPALATFLAEWLTPSYAQRVQAAEAACAEAKIAPNEALAAEKRCLIPADFGFHNILKQEGGALGFIDFEYFGWDDPVKLVADTLLHPGHTLGEEGAQHFYRRMLALFSEDLQFSARLRAFLPLFSLRWALILCNEFLPEKRSNRAFAAAIAEGDAAAWEKKKQTQLAKAMAMVNHPALAL